MQYPDIVLHTNSKLDKIKVAEDSPKMQSPKVMSSSQPP